MQHSSSAFDRSSSPEKLEAATDAAVFRTIAAFGSSGEGKSCSVPAFGCSDRGKSCSVAAFGCLDEREKLLRYSSQLLA
jgi:hypothetical protein